MKTLLTLLLIFITINTYAQKQNFPFAIRLEKLLIKDFPRIQSFAYATWQGKWLIAGGRKDGLHRRQPFAAFDEQGQNNFFYVIDPLQKKVWKKGIQHLPATIKEQLQSTNMQFCQTGNKLILTGGYGYSKTQDEHITHPRLMVIDISKTIEQVINGETPKNIIVQIKDERMAVAGGRLAVESGIFLLAGGHTFTGSYNPMGPDQGPGFTQQYTNEIRKFEIDYTNDVPVISNYSALHDSINLHRRDYNLVPQIFSPHQTGFTMYSGVFQYNADVPFTNSINIVNGSYTVNNIFQQQYNHYHCAVLPMYSAKDSTMHSVFFGGIAQKYISSKGKTITDNDVPFTHVIAVITRYNDSMYETILPLSLPSYYGAASEFIAAPQTPLLSSGILNADSLDNEVLAGYITGGIISSGKNIFWDNTGAESKANNTIFSVYIKRKKGNIKSKR